MAHPSLVVFARFDMLFPRLTFWLNAMPGLISKHLGAAASQLLTLLALGWLRVTRPERVQPDAAAILDAGTATHQDLLTGLPDRHALEEKLAEEWRRERRPHEPTALLLVEVDQFEALQKESGQLAADVALLTLTRALGRMLPRRADLLARYDNSTVAVVLPATDLPGALRVAARLRWSIVRLGIAHSSTESGFLTIGLGIAVQHGLGQDGPVALVSAANHALLKARQGGDDRMEYVVQESSDPAGHLASAQLEAATAIKLPAIRAWVPSAESGLHTLQS